MVAHNSSLNQEEFEEIKRLRGEVCHPIEAAINKIDEIIVPEQERDSLAESIAVGLSSLYGEFIHYWKILEAELKRLINENIDNKIFQYRGVKPAFIKLRDIDVIDDNVYRSLKKLVYVRNSLVHETDVSFSDDELRDMVRELKSLTEQLQIM